MERIQVMGGEVVVTRGKYGVDYTVDVMAHPCLTRLPLETRLLILEGEPRRMGTRVTRGGCELWTPEQFLDSVAGSCDLADALATVLREDNYVSRALGVSDFEAAKNRVLVRRQQRLELIRYLLRREGIDVADRMIDLALETVPGE